MQEVYGDQNTSNNTQAKDRFPFFFFLPFDSFAIYELWIARCWSRGSLCVIYIRDRSLHHLDLESLSLPLPSFFFFSPSWTSRVRDQVFDRELIESEKKNACLRVEYHHNVIVGGWKGRPWTGEIQHGDVHGALPVDHHRGCRREGCHVRHGEGRGEPRRFESCCHFFRPRLIHVDHRFPRFIPIIRDRSIVRDMKWWNLYSDIFFIIFPCYFPFSTI